MGTNSVICYTFASTRLTNLRKGTEGSKIVEVCLTCHLLTKSLRFFGNTLKKISLHLTFNERHLHCTSFFQQVVELLVQNNLLSHFPF